MSACRAFTWNVRPRPALTLPPGARRRCASLVHAPRSHCTLYPCHRGRVPWAHLLAACCGPRVRPALGALCLGPQAHSAREEQTPQLTCGMTCPVPDAEASTDMGGSEEQPSAPERGAIWEVTTGWPFRASEWQRRAEQERALGGAACSRSTAPSRSGWLSGGREDRRPAWGCALGNGKFARRSFQR